MRYFIRFAYFGKAYHGWQNQPNAITVQEVLEKALTTLLRQEIKVVGAGRTDAGVHAREMYAHFDTALPINRNDLPHRLNTFLPDAISVQEIVPVKADAHARFDATERVYEYWLVQHKNPFYTDFAHCVHYPLDVDAMNQAAQYLLSHTHFECFSKSNSDVKTFNCDVTEAKWILEGNTLTFYITANRFLRNMVRAIVGTLVDVGKHKITKEDFRKIILSKDRSNAGLSVPAKGLFLTSITY